jgi:hypothetical protein
VRLDVAFVSAPNYSGLRWLVRPSARSRRWLITDDALRVTDNGVEKTWRWSAVAYVRLRRHEYLFRQVSGLTIDLPRAALTAGQHAELRAFLADRRIRVT